MPRTVVADRVSELAPSDPLLNAAVEALASNPGACMFEIAAAAGVSRATLHRRFAGRTEMIAAVGEWALTQLENINRHVTNQDLTGRAAIERLLEEAIHLAPKIGFLAGECALENEPAFAARIEAAMSYWIGFIEDGQRVGEIRVDLPARWIAVAMEGLFFAVFSGIRRGEVAPADALRLVRSTLLEGVLAPPANANATSQRNRSTRTNSVPAFSSRPTPRRNP